MSAQLAFAQTDASLSLQKPDRDSVRSKYIKAYPDKFFIWPVLKQRTLAFDIANTKNGSEPLRYKPNNSVGAGVGIYAFDLGLELVFSLPVPDQRVDQFGKSKSLDLQLNMLSRAWGGDVYYQQYEGYYLSNPAVPVPAGAAYPIRPDFRTENFGVAGIYIFNHNTFSLRSAFTFADRQLKSKGSFILSGTYNDFKLEADSAILRTTDLSRSGLGHNITSISLLSVGVVPGYSHNFIIRNWFISLTIGLGPAFQSVKISDPLGKEYTATSVNGFFDGRFAAGYATDRFFAGVTITSQARDIKIEDARFTNASSTFRLLAGIRIQEKGFLTKSVWDIPRSIFK